jgi:hypothetical protein
VLEGRGRADAEIEPWHNAFSLSVVSHPTPSRLMDHIVKEQKKTELKFRKIKDGQSVSRNKDQIKLDKSIKDCVEKFSVSGDLLEFSDLMEVILMKDTNKINSKPLELDDVFESVLNDSE